MQFVEEHRGIESVDLIRVLLRSCTLVLVLLGELFDDIILLEEVLILMLKIQRREEMWGK